MSEPCAIIRPESIAAKQAALQNLRAPRFQAAAGREPRLIDLLWFLQWQSMQPGGLEKFVEAFVAEASPRLGTPVMHRIGKPIYNARERQDVIASVPAAESFFCKESRETVLASQLLNQFNHEMVSPDGGGRPDLAFVNQQNHSYFLTLCRDYALAQLPADLARFCAEPNACLPDAWYLPDLAGALLAAMDARSARAKESLAMTCIARDVFDALDFAWTERAMVEISGDSRFGKTESAKTYCAMHPGRARLVKTPCDNSDRSLLEAIAAAIGIEVTLQTTLRQLKASVEYVLKHSGRMFVFDEAAWLLPQRYTPKTTPMRLNYLRSQLLENGCPVVLIKTPQFFGPAAQRFERVTGFNASQFNGRIMRSVTLPAELPEEDLLAVVNCHFAGLKPSYKTRIVAAALISESYLFAVEKIAKNARAVARKKGREQIELADLEAGIRLAGINVQSPALAPMIDAPRPAPSARRRETAPPAMATEARRASATAAELLPARSQTLVNH